MKAVLKREGNEIGERASDEEMRCLRIQSHAVCPAWNYTLHPRDAHVEINRLIPGQFHS
jgi:hypothetical protein